VRVAIYAYMLSVRETLVPYGRGFRRNLGHVAYPCDVPEAGSQDLEDLFYIWKPFACRKLQSDLIY
jgi:hypothetical protein